MQTSRKPVQVNVPLSHPAMQEAIKGRTMAVSLEALCAHERSRGFTSWTPETTTPYRPATRCAHEFAALYTPRRDRRPQKPETCPLCADELQQSGQRFVAIRLGNRRFHALANPFGVTQWSLTIAADTHRPQWGAPMPADDGEPLATVQEMIALAESLPGYVIIGNGTLAGASLPGHAHHQALRLPDGHGLLAVERVTQGRSTEAAWCGVDGEYPVVFHHATGNVPDVARKTAAAMCGWRDVMRAHATGNLLVQAVAGGVEAYFFPRDARTPQVKDLAGIPGALECCGIFVMSADWEQSALQAGRTNTSTLCGVLRAISADPILFQALI